MVATFPYGSAARSCDHKYVYAGMRYNIDETPRPGTGALTRVYAHTYYCERCLEHRFQVIEHKDTTYELVRFNATPDERIKF